MPYMMSIALASTWQPRGELPRLQRYHARLMESFESLTIVLPSSAGDVLVAALDGMDGVYPVVAEQWARGRHIALESALKRPATHILYCDLDRIIRWVELYPDELAATMVQAQSEDCFVIGRTLYAWETHPRSLRHTEQIINEVFAHVMGVSMDICVATRGFSRVAAERVLRESQAESSLGVDGEWLYIVRRAGMTLDYLQVDGMDLETADQGLDTAADAERQRAFCEAYDAEASNWAQRVFVANQIIGALLRIAKE
jgi:hypothetical protein